jgi:hypothetical protein
MDIGREAALTGLRDYDAQGANDPGQCGTVRCLNGGMTDESDVAMSRKGAITLLVLTAISFTICSSTRAVDLQKSTRSVGSTVKTVGDHFVQDGREIVFTGINYFPAYYPPISPGSWLDSRSYRPDVVEDELKTIENLGFNLVSIQGLGADTRPSEQDCANLRDFLARAGQHKLLVNLYIGTGALVPIAKPEKLAVIPKVCGLAGNAALFAYDIAWEAHFGSAALRSALQQPWLRWLNVSYGSIQGADMSLGGTHAMPTDAELCSEAPDVRVSAYKRFLDDTLSQNYRDVRRAILTVDSSHLIGARSGYGGNGSRSVCGEALVDLRAGAKHLDFISPEGYALDPTDENSQLSRGGFTTAYADIGKPILWAEFGINVDNSCSYCSEDVQAGFFSNMWKLIRHGRSNGGVAWWFVGVRSQSAGDGEKSDYGIVYDYMKYPTSVDGYGKHARSGSLALCVSNPTRQTITRWENDAASEASACPQGLASRGRFRSEASHVGLPRSEVRREGMAESGWQSLCSRDDSQLLVTTVDEGTGERFECPQGYDAAGSFKPADSANKDQVIASDANGRSIKGGWVTLCTRDRSATLKLVYNRMSGGRASCPNGSVTAGVITPKSAPVFRPAAQQIAGALSGITAAKYRYSAWITVNRDAFAGDWKMYEEGTRSYALAAAKVQSVGVRTACFGSTSRIERSCVGNAPFDKSCPAKCLNSEWNDVEILNSDAQWQQVREGGTVTVTREMPVHARLSAGNVGESTWATSAQLGGTFGAVRFGCNENTGDLNCRSDIDAEVPGGSDAASGDIVISNPITKTIRIAFQMVAEGVTWFGERVNVTVIPK